ncbi:protoporphyrinogen oxidase [Pullulanibacillus sp. KACC 23026]|uniref:protoporphyrinogen oxidase n=1 Tax=Pullulanibacillus sp. KACC 23026 TaxID=3028315 RepID=UPI0023AECF08|nr:protoporphyrinogen oxidase [Pullulanibacillus sp. KACC 23026]WEG12021.1 protoporphyrinogen oxidase [Pullulanibacillus sp. KACC 23026]
MKVAIIGGGISGLSAAFYLKKLSQDHRDDIDITIFEKDAAFGGKIQTVRRDGFVIERGPDSFLKRKPAAMNLVEDLGLSKELIENKTGQSYILKGGDLHLIPPGSVMGVPTSIHAIMETGLLSEEGKARALNDLIIPKLEPFEDISVGAFFAKRFGEELVDHLISPLLSGIYAGDIYKLSLATTLPQFVHAESEQGSLMLGLQGKAPRKRTSQFATLQSGLATLVEELVNALRELGVTLRSEIRVEKIFKLDNGYELGFSNGESAVFDQIIFAIPHHLVEALLPEADFLRRPDAAPNTSVATIAMAFDEKDVKLDREGTGFVSSRLEPKALTACTWTHMKWDHAAPEGKALLRTYVGKAGNDQVIYESDETLVNQTLQEMSDVVSISADPDFAIVSRWPEAMPQYPVGHQAWLNNIKQKLAKEYPHLHLIGASYDGVGLPDCIRQGKQLAQDLLGEAGFHA